MEGENRLLDTITLDNGLQLLLRDGSRRLAGDRYLVVLNIIVAIPLHDDLFQDLTDPDEPFAEFIAAFGPDLPFRQERVRHFVPESQVSTLLDQLKAEFLSSGLRYISSPAFSVRYVMKEYESWKTKRRWQAAHEQAVAAFDASAAGDGNDIVEI